MSTQWKTTYSPTEVETVNCPLCGAQTFTQLAQEWSLGIVQCSDCDLVYINPRVREPEKNYWTSREALLQKYGDILAGAKPHNRDRNYQEHLAMIRAIQPTGRFLDVGTHCGFFLRLARQQGWELYGVEPSPYAAALAHEKFGLQVHPGYLEPGLFPDSYFDVITLTDVLEHVTNPLTLMTTASNLLKPGGILFIKVPNVTWNFLKYQVLNQQLKLAQFDIFNAREHVVHYTEATLSKLLDKVGLDLYKTYVPRPIQDGQWWQRSTRSIAYTVAKVVFQISRNSSPLMTDLACIARKPLR